MSRNRLFVLKASKDFSVRFSNKLGRDFMNVEGPEAQPVNLEIMPSKLNDGAEIELSHDITKSDTGHSRLKMFSNRFLNFVRLSSVLNNAAESFFKSEIRRRLFVTAVLLLMSRVGYFIPLPGFDRRLIPQDYLSFVSGSVGKHFIYMHETWAQIETLILSL